MLRFTQKKALQQFVSVHNNGHNDFNFVRYLIDRQTYRFAAPAE